MALGASHTAACPPTRKYGAISECSSSADSGEKEANASTRTVVASTPRTKPNAPPSRRSNQRSPASAALQRINFPIAPAMTATTIKIDKKLTRFATQGALTYGKTKGASLPYCQAARRYPTTTPAKENTSEKKPCEAATRVENTTMPSIT